MWRFGAFVENAVSTYAHATKESGSGKNKKHERPSEGEIGEYRRALIEQTPYSKANIRKRKPRKKLSDVAQGPGGARKIVQEPGKPMRVE